MSIGICLMPYHSTHNYLCVCNRVCVYISIVGTLLMVVCVCVCVHMAYVASCFDSLLL